MPMKLAVELSDARCDMDTQTFRYLVRSTFLESYGGMTDEDLYCDPVVAMQFAQAVRRRTRAPGLSDKVVLRTLTSIRKRGQLPRLKDRVSTPPTPEGARVHAKPAAKATTRKTASKTLGAIQAL